jgi:eukaryotic-like serine/threonine-protein kinase
MHGTLQKSGDLIASRYKVITYIGAGGMQEVYCATDLSFDRQVALKAPKNKSAKKRFSRSAEVSAKVNHPNVAKTLDYIPTADTNYLIEEFITGQDLQARLNLEFYFLDPHLAAHLLHHVAKGVAAVHHVGVFHRDLKPSNIMLSNDAGLQVVKVTDFGIAKMAETEIDEAIIAGEDSITGSQTAVGALPYMAPEMFQNPKTAGLPADIWALGAILFHALVGERPFGAGLQAIPRIIARAIPAKDTVLQPRAQFKALVDELWGVLDSCLQLDPSARPTADQLVHRLSQICYSTATRHIGWIKNYKLGTGDWGFISQPGDGDCFFHKESYYGGTPESGAKVNFACFPGDPRPRAFPVLPIKDQESPART